ncbi:MAG: nitronate monooxygenase [Achromobacter mucicolens]
MASPLIELLKLDHPIIQAPMAGGATTVELVAEASKAGALGSLGAAYMTPEQIDAAAAGRRGRPEPPMGKKNITSVPPQPKSGQ